MIESVSKYVKSKAESEFDIAERVIRKVSSIAESFPFVVLIV